MRLRDSLAIHKLRNCDLYRATIKTGMPLDKCTVGRIINGRILTTCRHRLIIRQALMLLKYSTREIDFIDEMAERPDVPAGRIPRYLSGAANEN